MAHLKRGRRHWATTASGLLLAALVAAGCDGLVQPGDDVYAPEYFLESYQIAGESMQPVRITQTGRIDERYRLTDQAVDDAQVTVTLLDEAGGDERVFRFTRGQAPGRYDAPGGAVVEPLRRYRLDVALPDGDRLTAETLVPGTFEILDVSADTATYGDGTLFEFDLTLSRYPGRQSYYIFTTEALDVAEENLTPFARAVLGDEPSASDLEEIRLTAAPILNEANYDIVGDRITVQYPSIGVQFYGRNIVAAHAIDDNLYDFFRSLQTQQGGSTFAPGEIPDVLDRVEGGTGFFGSMARVDYQLVIQPPAEAARP